MRVIDGFLVNDEINLMKLRMMELDPVVDTFVAVQMDRNLRGEPKDLHVDIRDPRFAHFRDKLKVVSIKGLEFGPHPEAEWSQRIALGAELERQAEIGDILMLSDVDEIPSRRVVSACVEDGIKSPVALVMRLYYYRINLRMMRPWVGTVIWPHGCCKDPIDAQEMRNNRHFLPQIADAGWHFSWFGDAKAVQRKLRNLDVPADAKIFGGGIDNIPDPDDFEAISARVDADKDLFLRSDPQSTLIEVDIEPGTGQPTEIRSWMEALV